MNKNINIVAVVLFVQVLSCWPLILRYYTDFSRWCVDARICMILDIVMAVTAISIFFSLLAMVFKAYKTALAIMIIPFFVQAVVVCSAAFVFIFHRELTAAMAMGKLKTAGITIVEFLKAPVYWCKKLIS